MRTLRPSLLILSVMLFIPLFVWGQDRHQTVKTEYIPIGKGWARTSVNAVIFRQNSVVSHRETQYAAYYNPEGALVLAKRKLGGKQWEIRETRYSGEVQDAHNSISIAVDGNGVLHVAWNHHNSELQYARSRKPGSLALTERLPMTGSKEHSVTYPQFYLLDNGDLLFSYRDGSSGNGNVMLNRYLLAQKQWAIIAHPLIDGHEERNAYINTLAVDGKGHWHISWTWRETWDVATNHDIMYARTDDGGASWQNSRGEKYELPITADNAEVVKHIPQGSELINQTSMTVTPDGDPVIATYWRPEGDSIPQFHVVWQDQERWKVSRVGKRTQPFSLSGGGTKRIPVSRPHVLSGDDGDLYMVFRDLERSGGITVAISDNPEHQEWITKDIHPSPVGMWEPSYDPVMWKKKRELHLFGQYVDQGDQETMEDIEPQEVFILKWTPERYR